MQRVNLSVFNTADFFWSQALLTRGILYDLFRNIVTGGYKEICVSLNSQREIQKLELKQACLRDEAKKLNEQWSQLEEKWQKLVEEFRLLGKEAQVDSFKGKITQLSQENETTYHFKTRFIKKEISSHYLLQVLKCMGIWIVNVTSLGLYGVYQRKRLKGHLHIVQEQESRLKELQTHHYEFMRKNLTILSKRFEDYRQSQERLDDACRGEKGLVFEEIERLREKEKDLKRQEETLTKEKKELITEVTALKTEKAILQKQIKDSTSASPVVKSRCMQQGQVFEQLSTQYRSKKALYEDLKRKCAVLEKAEEEERITLEKILKEVEKEHQSQQAAARQVKSDVVSLHQEESRLRLEIDRMSEYLRAIYQELQVASKQEGSIQALKQDSRNLQDALTFHSLQPHLGPIEPLYKLRKNEEGCELDQIKGALGIRDFDGKAQELWSDYAKRYNHLSTPHEIFKAGVLFALQVLYRMALQEPEKIQLSQHWYQIKPTEDVLYCVMALDLIEGGEPEQDACAGYVLWLNNKNMKMFSADPMRAVEYRQVNGKNQLKSFIFYRKRDAFTPSEKVLAETPAASGIYPVEAKCLWAQLTEEEKKYLVYFFIKPVMKKDHSDHSSIMDCMHGLAPENQQRIEMLRELIIEIGIALKLKFGRSLTQQDWKGYIDQAGLTETVKQYDDQYWMPWKYDDCFLEVREDDPEQQPWIDLLLSSQKKYQNYFDYLHSPSLVRSMNSTSELKGSVTGEDLMQQYYIVEQKMGGQGSLFPNLLAMLMSDGEQVNVNNLMKFQEAIATYLDHPQNAQRFAQALEEEHHCQVEEYKDWLRCISKNHQFDFLSRVQIEIVAHALGIRIALLYFSDVTVGVHRKWETHPLEKDEYGRIVPIHEYKEGIRLNYFGPPTREFLFLAASTNAHCREGDLYGLFPKLTGDQLELKTMKPQDLACIQHLQNYWKERENF